MEVTKIEVNAVELVIAEERQAQIQKLGELELALVGGGIGDVILG